MKKLKIAWLLLCFALVLGAFFPKMQASANWIDTNIVVSKLDIVANVNLKNQIEMVETIDVDFLQTRSVFVRSLPTSMFVTREENENEIKRMRYNLHYFNIRVEDEHGARLRFEEVEEDSYLFLEIGKDGSMMYPQNTTKTFVFRYIVALGNDRIAEYDEFYFNIVGTDWACPVNQISWEINLPQTVETELVQFVGYDNSFATPFSGNKIVGTWASLNAYEGITFRALLPQNYFSQAPRPDLFVPYLIAMLALLVVVMMVLRLKHQTKFHVTPTVRFDVPNNLDPCEVGFAFDGRIDTKDISSLIVYWANKGYLTITEKDKQISLIKNEVISEFEMTPHEKEFFNKLFLNGNVANLKRTDYAVAEGIQKLKLKLNDKKEFYFHRPAIGMQMLVALLGALCLGIPIGYAHWMLNTEISFVAGMVMIGLGVVINMLAIERKFYEFSNHGKTIFLFAILSTIFTGGFIFLFYFTLNGEAFGNPLLLFIAATIAFLISTFLCCHFVTRKEESSRLIGDLLGLKQFILTADKSRIEMLAKENPSAFYDVLPYAYVLGVSDVWIKQFDHIVLANPAWLQTDRDIFDTLILYSILSNMNSRMYSVAHAQRPTNTGSGFGGGGFGGGFGGGGFGGGGGFSR